MFKEAFITLIFIFIITVMLSLLLSKKRRTFQVCVITLLCIGFVCNTVYNLRHLFPNFILDETVPLGDCKENLFLYKEDSEFPCEILFPILQDRTILLDTSCDFYDTFFTTFSEEMIPFELPRKEELIIMANQADFSFCAENNLIYLLDYAFPANDYTDIPMLPNVYIHIDSLEGEKRLIALIDPCMHIYLMSETYYYESIKSEVSMYETPEM